ncbi:MAG: tetratricopeptide repeat protein [Puniceicoccales bacterium]|jgi:tetratricopeptide (TPR) repeat protein|nr:tetratricopeptide repeat protein [Puniceicoccales bacterium]
MKSFAKLFLVVALIFCRSVGLAEGKLPNDAKGIVDFIAVDIHFDKKFESLINSGNGAYKIGFFTLAKKFFKEALAIKGLSNEQKCIACTGFLESCLASGEFSDAMELFDMVLKLTHVEVSREFKNKFLLNAAIAACFKHDFAVANKILLKLDVKTFDDNELAWYHAIRSVIFAMAANFEEMEKNLEEAKKHSPSIDQSVNVQAFVIQFLLQFPMHSAAINNLLGAADIMYKKYKLQRANYPFVKTYALMLIHSGNRQKAKDLLDEQIANTKDSNVQDLQSLYLYRAIADGLSSASGLNTVLELLLSTANDELKKQALKLLLLSVENTNQRMEAIKTLSDVKLQTFISKNMMRHILFAKLRLAIDAENLTAAQRITEEIVLQFPKEALIKNIYHALAYLAWQQEPKDYRMSAHYLGKVRDVTIDDAEKINMTIQIGNAFYLSEAYDIAAHIYEEVLKTNVDNVKYDKILCQLIQADIKSKNLALAEQHLQSARQCHNLFTEYRWHAELLYIDALIGDNNSQQAMEYLSMLLDTYPHKIQPFYLVKFYLLQAYSLFSKQHYQQAHIAAANICTIFPTKSSSAEISQIVGQALFMKGVCELKSQNKEAAFSTFERLRSDYADQEVAMLSYFEEGEYFLKSGNVSKACNALLTCAEAKSIYSPFAYYRCSEYCKSLGMAHYDEAITHLSTLIAKYGNHEIIYAAHLELADLLRLGGRFSDAQLVYEELLKNFPFDKRYHFTEFCLAKAIFAQKNKDDLFIERAQMILERLYSLAIADRSLHIEIAAMYCFILQASSSTNEMKQFAWETLLSSFSGENILTQNDVHWLMQIVNLLRDYYSLNPNDLELKTLKAIANKLETSIP